MTNNEQLKLTIEKLKIQTGLKQSEIADRISVKSTYLSDMINGRVPVTEKLLAKLSEEFHITIFVDAMTGKEIIDLILNDLGIKAPTFAKSIGLKYQRILDIQSGKTKKLSATVVKAILEKYPQYNPSWLFTGEGQRFNDNSANVIGGVNNGINNSGTITKATIDNRTYNSDSPDVLRAQIDQLDLMIQEKDCRIKEKDAQIKEKDAQIKEKDAQIKALLEIIAKK